MKKIIALLLVAVFAVGLFCSCATKSTIIVAYTVYKPMNYVNDNGEFVGFDTELTKAVFEEKLGYKVIFKEIDWNQKYLELEAGTIDCIWNGFTSNIADPDGVMRNQKVDFSYNYMLNKQVVVTTDRIAETVTDFTSLAGKVGGVEEGSAGDAHLDRLTRCVKKSCESQLDALRDLVLGDVDFVVIDEQLAESYVGNGDFAGLTVVECLSGDPEYYAVGFKKGSALTAKVNAALEELAAEGRIQAIADKYRLVTAITDFSDQK